MAWQQTILWTVSPHAKQRAWERYGVLFSPQKWIAFCNTLRKEKQTIFLGTDHSGSCRIVCFFQQRKFLIGGNTNGRTGVISTFLPETSLTDDDKMLLRSYDQYMIDGDWNFGLPKTYSAVNRKTLKAIPLLPEELPSDFDLVGKLLEKEMRRISDN